MCFSDAPPMPPVQTFTPPPAALTAPTRQDANVKKAKNQQRSVAARSQGRDSTILGGQLARAPDNQPRKTLLGA